MSQSLSKHEVLVSFRYKGGCWDSGWSKNGYPKDGWVSRGRVSRKVTQSDGNGVWSTTYPTQKKHTQNRKHLGDIPPTIPHIQDPTSNYSADVPWYVHFTGLFKLGQKNLGFGARFGAPFRAGSQPSHGWHLKSLSP